jgi:hypothetical protein
MKRFDFLQACITPRRRSWKRATPRKWQIDLILFQPWGSFFDQEEGWVMKILKVMLMRYSAGLHGRAGIQGDDRGRKPLHADQRASPRLRQDRGGGCRMQEGGPGGAAVRNSLPLPPL